MGEDAAVGTNPRATFLAAAEAVADLVDRIPPDAWTGPGLGVWDLRALVGHTGRALVTVATYLAQRAPAADAPEPDVATPEAYYVAVRRAGGADTEAVAERGRAAGAALGDAPAAAFRALLADAVAALDAADDGDVVPTAAGRMRVGDYLPTRTFELAVHGADIAAATGLAVAPPPEVLAEAAALAARAAVALGNGPAVLAVLTGRTPLLPGLSVV